MASRITPNWTQGNEVQKEPRVVPTYKNTSFTNWKKLVTEQMVILNVVNKDLNNINTLHGWENGETPSSFASSLLDKERKAADRKINPMR